MAAMKKLYVMRHGETEWNIQKRYQGQMDSGLTETGIARTRLQRDRIDELRFGRVFCSPLGRTRATLDILQPNTDRVIFDERLKEICLGVLQGKTHEELSPGESEEHLKLWKDPASFRVEGAETMAELEDRIRSFLEELKQRDEDILVITHTIIIKMILKILDAKPLERFWDEPYLHPASILVLDTDKKPVLQEVIYPEQNMGIPVSYTA